MLRAMPFIGRANELDACLSALEQCRRGRGQHVLIEGEAGVGKTRLMQEVLDAARRDGFDVLDVTCDVGERATPFAAVGRLLVDRVPGPVTAQAEGEDTGLPALQFRIVEALGALVEERAARCPLLVAVDDLHWADESTLLALRLLGGRIETLPVTLLTSHRAGVLRPALALLVERFVRRDGTLLTLQPLDDRSIAELARALAGDAGSSLIERLGEAAGNPLYLMELADATAAGEGVAGETLPVAFRTSVVRRLGTLPVPVQDMLRVAALLGSTFDARHVAVAMRSSVIELAPLIEEAVAAGVLRERNEALAFRHDLVREAVYQNVPAGLRRDLHREVGQRLGAAGIDLLIVAQQVSLGAEPVDPDAAGWLCRAADDVASRAPAVAVDLLERALGLLPASSPEILQVQVDLALAYAWSGRMRDAEALARDVLAHGPEPAVSMTLRAGLVRAMTWQGRPAEALTNVGLNADEVVDGPEGALLASETALAALLTFAFPVALPAAHRAEHLATLNGDDGALCQSIAVQAWLAMFMGNPHEAVTLARRAITIADASLGQSAHRAQPCFFAGMPLVLLDQLDEAYRHLRAGRRRAEERGYVWSLPLYHAHLGVAGFAAGDWDTAVAELEAGLVIADEIGLSTPMVAAAAAWLAVIQLHRDDLRGAERTIAEALARMVEGGPQGGPILNWARATLHEARGELTQALALLQGAFDMFMAGGNLTDPWSVMTLVRLCTQTGDRERAAALLPVLEHQASVTGTPFMRGQALRARGLLDGDADTLLEAVAEYRQCPRPSELAAACEDAGELLARAGRREDGVTQLLEAMEIYESLAAARDAARVRSTLRQHGVRRTGHRRATGALGGWDSLSDTEQKVAALVAQRLSNPEVAERLFVSRHTVESHLKSIYRKLGISSRLELSPPLAQG
jgi:DNA-binding CsgD family transcriptional regulator